MDKLINSISQLKASYNVTNSITFKSSCLKDVLKHSSWLNDRNAHNKTILAKALYDSGIIGESAYTSIEDKDFNLKFEGLDFDLFIFKNGKYEINKEDICKFLGLEDIKPITMTEEELELVELV